MTVNEGKGALSIRGPGGERTVPTDAGGIATTGLSGAKISCQKETTTRQAEDAKLNQVCEVAVAVGVPFPLQ